MKRLDCSLTLVSPKALPSNPEVAYRLSPIIEFGRFA
jgi:hypothetical protein